MSVYEGIMQGLSEALDHAEGNLPLRTNRVSTKAMEPLEVFMPQEIKEIRIELGTDAALLCRLYGRLPQDRGSLGSR